MLFQRIAKSSQVTIQRGMLRPQINIPYRGIYRRDGDNVRKNDVLVVQKHVNYHPGLNVSHQYDRGAHILKAMCDGTVMITREPVNLNTGLDEVSTDYQGKVIEDLHKFHFNVVARTMSNRFKLVDEV